MLRTISLKSQRRDKSCLMLFGMLGAPRKYSCDHVATPGLQLSCDWQTQQNLASDHPTATYCSREQATQSAVLDCRFLRARLVTPPDSHPKL